MNRIGVFHDGDSPSHQLKKSPEYIVSNPRQPASTAVRSQTAFFVRRLRCGDFFLPLSNSFFSACQSVHFPYQFACAQTHTHTSVCRIGEQGEKKSGNCVTSPERAARQKKGWKNFPFTIFKYERFYARMVSGPTLTRITKHLIIFLRIKTIQIMYGMYLRPCWHYRGPISRHDFYEIHLK